MSKHGIYSQGQIELVISRSRAGSTAYIGRWCIIGVFYAFIHLIPNLHFLVISIMIDVRTYGTPASSLLISMAR